MSTCATVSPAIPLTRSVIRRRAWATTSRIDAGHCTDIDTLTMTTSPSTRADVRAGVSSVAEPSACPNSVRGGGAGDLGAGSGTDGSSRSATSSPTGSGAVATAHERLRAVPPR